MSEYCECSTANQVVMTDGGVHKWTGDHLSVPFDPMVGPMLPVAAQPEMLTNRRPGCGKPVAPPPPVGGILEWLKGGAFWRRYPDGAVTGPHAESLAPAAHEGGAPVFIAHDAARPAIEREVRKELERRLVSSAVTGDAARELSERVDAMRREGHATAVPESTDGGAKARAAVAETARALGAGGPKPSLYGPCSKGCGAVAERDGYVTALGVYCPCGGLFAGLRFGEPSAPPDAYTHAPPEAERAQRAAVRAELDRKVEKRGGRK